MMIRITRNFANRALYAGLALIALSAASAILHAQTVEAPLPAVDGAPVPIPERNPKRIAPPPHPSQVKVADWSAQDIQEAMDRCAMILSDTGVVYRHLDSLREGRCGTPAPIELSAIGKNSTVTIMPPARVTCGMAASLSAWSDTILQPAARAHLGETITHIRNVASYVCRNRYNASDKPISEHARANALDMAAFKTSSGLWLTVLDHWALPQDQPGGKLAQSVSGVTQSQPDLPALLSPGNKSGTGAQTQPIAEHPEHKPESAFLRDIHAGACALFGTVLGPEANDSHKDHFHYDLAERKHANYCE